MPKRPRAVLQHAVLAKLPADVISAKTRLRDRLLPPVERQMPRALALRRVQRHPPHPGVNLLGVGVGENRLAIGAAVVQPATLDGGTDADQVARLADFAPLKFGNSRNWMDAAVARFDTGVTVRQTIP